MPHVGPAPAATPRRRFLVLIALSCCLTLASLALAQPSDAERMGFAGPVESVTIYQTYEPEEEEPRLRQEWTFGPDGAVTSMVFYSYSFMDGSLRFRGVTTYDADGRRTVQENVAPDGSILGTTTFAYDGEGREIEERVLDEDGTETRRLVSAYDDAGNLIVREVYRDGELAGRTEYDYDGEGRRVAARRFDADGTLERDTTYTVPDLEYEMLEYDEDGEVEGRTVVVAGDHGTLSAETFLPDGTLDNATYFAYDEAGRMVRREDTVTYEVLGEEQRDSSVTVYEYELDDVGNWVRRTSIEDVGMGPDTIELQVREITYH
jgi:YD repeat-containing protein